MAYAKFAELSNLLQNSKIHLKTRIRFLNSFVRSRLTYACQNWNLKSAQYDRLDVAYRLLLRRMVRGGFKRSGDDDENSFKYKFSNEKIHSICGTHNVSDFIKNQQKNYAGHLVRTSAERSTKKLLFNEDKCTKAGRGVPNLLEQVLVNNNKTMDAFVNDAMKVTGNRR